MALAPSTYQDALVLLFSEMYKNRHDYSLEEFADGFVSASAAFVNTGIVSTEDTGTVTAGAYSGKGTATGIVSEGAQNEASELLYEVCFQMQETNKAWGEAQFAYTYAEALGDANADELASLKAKLASAESAAKDGKEMMEEVVDVLCDMVENCAFTINSAGTVSTGTGEIPVTGECSGSFTGDRDTFKELVIEICEEMKGWNSSADGGDAYFAEQFARYFYDYLNEGTVTSTGDTGTLWGAVGTGSLL